MKLKFIEQNSGVGKNSGQPYHLLKLADPNTFENHTINYDPNLIGNLQGIQSGTDVEITGRLKTTFNRTSFVAEKIQPLKQV